MKLSDPDLLAAYMAKQNLTGAHLGRKAGITRQFVYQLLGGSRRKCSEERAANIEMALGLIPGTLFAPDEATITNLTQAGAGQTSAA
jgi:transcriptional regulator with XRE-family HTH domain